MFGIGATEFIFILVVLLLVVGPERLPGLARQGGQLLVRVRNWVQHSPDAAMVLRARAEIEQELANLKSSLAEVQSVRDQVVEAAKQVQQTVQDDVIAPTQHISKLLKDEVSGTRDQVQQALSGTASSTTTTATTIAAETSGDAAQVAASAADTATEAAEIALDAAQQALEAAQQIKDASSSAELPPINPVPLDTPGVAEPAANGLPIPRARTRAESLVSMTDPARTDNGDAAVASAVSPAAFEQLQHQIETLLADLHMLRTELQQRGVIGDGLPSTPPTEDVLEPALTFKGGDDVHE